MHALAKLGITQDEWSKVTFVTDNGANVVKALEEFRRNYCVCHALNICLSTGMSVKYHELIRHCIEASERALQVSAFLTVCLGVSFFIFEINPQRFF